MAKKTEETPFEALERLFHEPNRLAIMAALAPERAGLTFSELKEACRLTDGNLNRHLTALGAEGAVKLKKEFVGLKPRTTVFATKSGLDRFTQYLEALQQVLKTAKAALPAAARRGTVASGRTVTA